MVCPYCSADMTPIELNGKVFCSNCGLTIAAGATSPASDKPTINPAPQEVTSVTTEAPEEVAFETVAPATEAVPEPMIQNPEEIEPAETVAPPTDYFGQFGNDETNTVGRKLDVKTEMPITAEIAADLGISTDTVPEPIAATPVLESKIADLPIPTEDDFSSASPDDSPTSSSFVELANPGSEKETLEASGILLDILGEQKEEAPAAVEVNDDLDPVNEPELPEKTETHEEDDIYVLPTEVKVGLRNKTVSKTQNTKDKIQKLPEVEGSMLGTNIDPKTEEKIEKLEAKIASAPEPIVDLTPAEAAQYDPDTIDLHDIDPSSEKSKAIKSYFSTAIEKDKKALKAKSKKKQKSHFWKTFGISVLVIIILGAISIGGFLAYRFYQTDPTADISTETRIV